MLLHASGIGETDVQDAGALTLYSRSFGAGLSGERYEQVFLLYGVCVSITYDSANTAALAGVFVRSIKRASEETTLCGSRPLVLFSIHG